MDDRVENDDDITRLLESIFARYHYDFRSYARSSLRRRIAAAMTHFGSASLDDLRAHVADDASAFADLLRFLTVQVSDLFRDPSYFKALRERVVPYLGTYPSLKVWVAGCATGEE